MEKRLNKWEMLRYVELVYVLTERNLKKRYRGSFLGVYWSLLNPLVMTGMYTALFGEAFSQYYENSITNYALAAFTGLVVMNFFSASTSQALVSLVDSSNLLGKISLPFSIFPVAVILANIFQFFTGALPLLVLVTLIISKNVFHVAALVIPISTLIVLSLGMGFLLSPLYVRFRDIPYLYELVIFVLLFVTPIFYPSEIVPEKIRALLNLNPLASIIENIREISLSPDPPETLPAVRAALSSIVLFWLGSTYFQKSKKDFPTYL